MVVAGGTENMSRAPYLMPNGRWGQRWVMDKLLIVCFMMVCMMLFMMFIWNDSRNFVEEYVGHEKIWMLLRKKVKRKQNMLLSKDILKRNCACICVKDCFQDEHHVQGSQWKN